jgi:hypothetical protein
MADDKHVDTGLTQLSADPIPEEIPFATSPFDEEYLPPPIGRDQTVTHTTVGGKGVVGRIKVLAADEPLRQFLCYVCAGCEDAQEPSSWCCSARSLKALQRRGVESELLIDATFSSVARGKLTDYLNSRALPRPEVILSRYERPWVI